MNLGGIFEFETKCKRLLEIDQQLEDPSLWDQREKTQSLGRERSKLLASIEMLQNLQRRLTDAQSFLVLAEEENDEAVLQDVTGEVAMLEKEIAGLEFQRLFPGEMDANSAYMDIQSGSGGTEAQDWAEMLQRMYLRFGERRGFRVEIISISHGEVAGIKSATIKFEGSHAYGWLRTETGVHRLVRNSPFDSGHRRHTSFASVFVYPEVDESVPIEINPADLRVDTYRASGAGGQHVNRTDSAVRITHLPTNVVVQCQADRSQHKNRAHAMSQLKAKLYELEMQKRRTEKAVLESNKMDIGWGSQIRSYVLDDSRVKDLRTGEESGNPQAVLDGNLDRFIEASLKAEL
jgi:peptide chain release factor 2